METLTLDDYLRQNLHQLGDQICPPPSDRQKLINAIRNGSNSVSNGSSHAPHHTRYANHDPQSSTRKTIQGEIKR
jgi:hypothetical protein